MTSASTSSYVNGALGRGGNTSSTTSRTFEVGDVNGYRPVTLTTTTGITSGGYLLVRCISGDANNGSFFAGGIDRVSSVRYYQVTYKKGTGSTTSSGISKAALSYATGDGVVNGVTTLRVASSIDNRATWVGVSQTSTHTTSVSSTPFTITPDAFASSITMNDGGSCYVTLANSAGGGNVLPVVLSSFVAASVVNGVSLDWVTASELDCAMFEIERQFGAGSPWELIGTVPGSGNSTVSSRYHFSDRTVQTGRNVYRVKQIDKNGEFWYLGSTEIDAVGIPATFRLFPAYPNPFNPETHVEFSVATEGDARLRVFNMLGQEVALLFSGSVQPGRVYQTVFNAGRLPSGSYVAHLEQNGTVLKSRMLLIR